jgi:hypothetical protein
MALYYYESPALTTELRARFRVSPESACSRRRATSWARDSPIVAFSWISVYPAGQGMARAPGLRRSLAANRQGDAVSTTSPKSRRLLKPQRVLDGIKVCAYVGQSLWPVSETRRQRPSNAELALGLRDVAVAARGV